MNTKIIHKKDYDFSKTKEYFKDVVILPTETVYGIAADIYNINAIQRIYEVKNRPHDNPLIVHISSLKMLDSLIEGPINIFNSKLIEKYWPGPLTLIFEAKKTLSHILTNNMSTVAIRMPDCEFTLNVIEHLGHPIVMPSANLSGRPSTTSASHVFDDLNGKVPLIIDGDECLLGIESTVVNCLSHVPTILRPGSITYEEICNTLQHKVEICTSLKNKPQQILPNISNNHSITTNESENTENRLNMEFENKDSSAYLSPGMKYKHYSPEKPLYLIKQNGNLINEIIISKVKENKNIIGCIVNTMNVFTKQTLETFKLIEIDGEEYHKKIYNEEIRNNILHEENMEEIRCNKSESPVIYVFCYKNDKKLFAEKLFKYLRFYDKMCDCIIAIGTEYTEEGLAVMDRLEKASTEIF
ncbi:telomere recombination protein [Hamiltosporidium magnivora]|uniref:Threonylcarbamoyl-AMP synthase n=1 Tax=Hamiltosporidium magnivora TaxID=148818 RepID=A0A4Q9LH37_9MICR|nr:telomere recombination protein [Hamiltosporidium magnivora]